MSSYLTFYLVPKKTKTKYDKDDKEIKVELTQEPLSLLSYCRSSDIYQAYYENLHPAYCGNEEKYTELTYQNATDVRDTYNEEYVKATDKRLQILYKMLRENYNSDIAEEILSAEEYLSECKSTLELLNTICAIVYEVTEGYGDFEKVLINID